MNWIDIDSHPASFHYDAERRSKGDNDWNLYMHNQNVWTEAFNPLGMTEGSHGIHPVEIESHNKQVSLETAQPLSIFASSIFDWVNTIFGSSLTGFFSFHSFYPRLKSRATLGRPYRDFERESIFTQITAFTTTNNLNTLIIFAVKKRRLI